MSDSRTVSGSIKVEHEGRFATAFNLMEKIARYEVDSKRPEMNSRDYWLKLYVECVDATYQNLPKHLK